MTKSSEAEQNYLKGLVSAHRSRIVINLLLLLLLGLLNGVGILLLLPLLEASGVSDGSRQSSDVASVLNNCFDFVGIPRTVPSILTVFVVIVGVRESLQRWHFVQNASLHQDFIQWMRNGLYESIIRANWLFFLKSQSSDFNHALHSDIKKAAKGTMSFQRLLSASVIAVVHILVAVLISPLLTGITVGSLLIYWPILSSQNRKASQAGFSATSRTKRFFARINDQLTGMKEVKVLGAECQQLELFYGLTSSINSANIEYARAQAATSMMYTFGAVVLLSGLVLIAIEVLQLPFAELAMIAVIFARLMPKLKDVHMSYQQLLHVAPGFASVMQLRSQCEAAREPEYLHSTAPLTIQSGIVLKGVSFRYDSQISIWAINDVNFEIPARQTTAIVGSSGAGKSTLADLLMGLVSPEQGSILLDGKVLDPATLHAWRSAIGYVPQETILLHDTIRANLLLAMPTASETDLNDALQMAAASGFVHSLPSGLDTVIGDRGTRLSGGERQRIALARALLRHPSVLILDEATSSLDAKNQKRIQDAIQQLGGKLTIIVIAHRLSTVRSADQIVVLDGGHVAESGSWAELVNRKGGRLHSLVASDEAA